MGPREPFMVRAGGFIGIGAVASTGFLYFWAIAAVPWYASVFLMTFWVLHLLLGIVWFTHRPTWAGWYLPVALPAVWFLVVIGGALAYDWKL